MKTMSTKLKKNNLTKKILYYARHDFITNFQLLSNSLRS